MQEKKNHLMVSKEKLLRILGRYKGRKKDEASSLWYRKFEANGSLSPPKVLDSHRFKKKKSHRYQEAPVCSVWRLEEYFGDLLQHDYPPHTFFSARIK